MYAERASYYHDEKHLGKWWISHATSPPSEKISFKL